MYINGKCFLGKESSQNSIKTKHKITTHNLNYKLLNTARQQQSSVFSYVHMATIEKGKKIVLNVLTKKLFF